MPTTAVESGGDPEFIDCLNQDALGNMELASVFANRGDHWSAHVYYEEAASSFQELATCVISPIAKQIYTALASDCIISGIEHHWLHAASPPSRWARFTRRFRRG